MIGRTFPCRVHIVGGPGSGKTTLAQRLAQRVGAPLYDLDKIGYESGAGAKRSLEVRLFDVQAILEQPSWVTEGIFLWWTDPLLRAADLIVWLDLPWYIAVWRIVLRHFKLSWAGINPHPGLMNLVRFVVWQVQHYYRRKATSPTGPDDDSAVTRGNRTGVGLL
ncbi:MAG: hypothetical protein ACRDIB_03350, partial [Ardenticatenaceae bacterium]